MDFDYLLTQFQDLNPPAGYYFIYGSGPLAVRGLRKAHDLDVVTHPEWYRYLSLTYPEIISGHLQIGDISIYHADDSLLEHPYEALERAEKIGNFYYLRLPDLIRFKQFLNRPKDRKDILLINTFLR